MPSYKTSTLSLMLISTTASIFFLALLVMFIAVKYPAAYEAISQKEYLVAIIIGAYILVWNNIWSAYLTQRGMDQGKNKNEPEIKKDNDSKPIVEDKIDDLYADKLEAHDTTNQ